MTYFKMDRDSGQERSTAGTADTRRSQRFIFDLKFIAYCNGSFSSETSGSLVLVQRRVRRVTTVPAVLQKKPMTKQAPLVPFPLSR
jgi:hypothetical protein